jgi:hypothetical protein
MDMFLNVLKQDINCVFLLERVLFLKKSKTNIFIFLTPIFLSMGRFFSEHQLIDSRNKKVCRTENNWWHFFSDLRINKLQITNSKEIKKFLGLILYMEIVKINPIANYWLTSMFYKLKLPRTIMS